MILIKKLEWDSDFFNIKIGRVSLDNSYNDFNFLLDENFQSGFNLIYVFSKNQIKLDNKDFKLVDEKLIYKINLQSSENYFSHSNIIEIIGFDSYHKQLYELTLRAGSFSRFKVDTSFPKGAFEKFYLKWLENSINGSFADIIQGYVIDNNLVGFITAKRELGSVSIGLIAVNEDYSGIGIGRALIESIFNWSLNNKINQVSVATQRDNVNACRFYESLGFEIIENSFIYHWWV
jgi:dTDP-4-amino-4,6-dideoxy-D-galactose acyltransferase